MTVCRPAATAGGGIQSRGADHDPVQRLRILHPNTRRAGRLQVRSVQQHQGAECLVKWQLIKLDMMVQSYQATVAMYRRLAPLQEKMFRHMEREVDDLDEADRWKLGRTKTTTRTSRTRATEGC